MMPTPDQAQRLELLVTKVAEGTLSEDEAGELSRMLESSAEARNLYIQSLTVAVRIRECVRGRAQGMLAAGTDLKFWFCEKCGKRLTDRDIAAGEARDKKLKGVYCAECAVGVLTLEMIPVSEAQARKILERRSESRAPSTESKGTASKADAPGEKRTFSKRIPFRPSRWTREMRSNRWIIPTLLVACLLVAATISLTVFKREPSQGLAREEQARREAAEKHKIAQDELAQKDEALKKAREHSARVAAEKRATEEKLAALEAERLRIAEAQRKAAENKQQATEAERKAHEEAIVRLDAQRKEEEARLAKSAEEQHKAEEEIVRAAAAQEAAKQQVAKIERKAEELGQIVFVVDLKGGGAGVPAGPILVRGGEKLPIAKGIKIQKGDWIKTTKSEKRNPQSTFARPVHAAIELATGAVVDLADATDFQALDSGVSKLEQGRLFADVSASTSNPGTGILNPRTSFKTPFADVETQGASFDLNCETKEAVLQLLEGTATFKNEHGERTLKELEKSVARKDYAPGMAAGIPASAIWSGRKFEPRRGLNLLTDPGFESDGRGWDQLFDPSANATVAGLGRSQTKALQVTLGGPDVDMKAHQSVPVESGGTYLAAGWLRAPGVGHQAFSIRVKWVDAKGNDLRSDVVEWSAGGSESWKEAAGQFVAPPSAARVRFLIFVVNSRSPGKAWFDDVFLGKVE